LFRVPALLDLVKVLTWLKLQLEAASTNTHDGLV
jgi:hypothetical protein